MSSPTGDVGTLPPCGPSSTPKLDFQTNLTLMRQQVHTNAELPDWLKQHGVITGSTTLERRLRK
jgi:hypothetical protein